MYTSTDYDFLWDTAFRMNSTLWKYQFRFKEEDIKDMITIIRNDLSNLCELCCWYACEENKKGE